MKRSTEVLSLVLIGSVVAMGVCRSQDDEDEQNNGGGRSGGVAYIGGRYLSGGRTVGSTTPSVSARGGFGGSAFATVAG
jgi:hypothetical protein